MTEGENFDDFDEPKQNAQNVRKLKDKRKKKGNRHTEILQNVIVYKCFYSSVKITEQINMSSSETLHHLVSLSQITGCDR